MSTESKSRRNTDYDSHFAKQMRKLIDEKCATRGVKESAIVGELASKTGSTRQAISQYKNGVVSPNAEKLCKIADYFNVSIDYLLGRSPTRSTDPNVSNFCKTTGLSNEAVETILALKNPSSSFENYTDILNHLLSCTDNVMMLLSCVLRYANALPSAHRFASLPEKERISTILAAEGIAKDAAGGLISVESVTDYFKLVTPVEYTELCMQRAFDQFRFLVASAYRFDENTEALNAQHNETDK